MAGLGEPQLLRHENTRDAMMSKGMERRPDIDTTVAEDGKTVQYIAVRSRHSITHTGCAARNGEALTLGEPGEHC
jgi:hypothetical protein